MSYHLLALLLLPLVGSGLVFALKQNFSKYLALAISFVQMLVTFCVLSSFDFTLTVDSVLQHEINWTWSDFIRSSIHFGLDGMSLLMVLLTNILVPLIILSSFNNVEKPYPNSFYALILLMQFGLVGVFTALDGLLFYVFWEVTLIPIWFIAGMWGQDDKKFSFTTKFFVYTFVGSLFMLAGLVYLYTQSASFALTDLYNVALTSTEETVVFWFISFAFAVKLPIFPFHTWQPDTYTYSPTQGTMLLSGIMLKMAVFGVLRWLLPIAPNAIAGTSGGIVLMLCVFGIIYGALIAIVQNDAKRLIAYSSLSHIGLLAGGIFASAILTLGGKVDISSVEGASFSGLLHSFSETFTIQGGEGAMAMAFAHGINAVGLFYCADILYKRFGTRDIRQMGGLARVAPKFAVLFMIILFGSLGVPLTNGFIGEFILIKSIFDYSTLMGIIAGITIILAAVYLLRLYAKSMFGEGNEEKLSRMKDLSNVEFSVLASLAVFVIIMGIFPQVVLDMVNAPLRYIFQSMLDNFNVIK